MFKSGNQRKFMFAMDRDKQKGLSPQKPSLGLPAIKPVKPTMNTDQGLPSMPKMSNKFSKIKKYLKREF